MGERGKRAMEGRIEWARDKKHKGANRKPTKREGREGEGGRERQREGGREGRERERGRKGDTHTQTDTHRKAHPRQLAVSLHVSSDQLL